MIEPAHIVCRCNYRHCPYRITHRKAPEMNRLTRIIGNWKVTVTLFAILVAICAIHGYGWPYWTATAAYFGQYAFAWTTGTSGFRHAPKLRRRVEDGSSRK